MKKLLDLIGSFFVYRSPSPKEGFANFLEMLPSRKLKSLAGTKTHYSKKQLVQIILLDSMYGKSSDRTEISNQRPSDKTTNRRNKRTPKS